MLPSLQIDSSIIMEQICQKITELVKKNSQIKAKKKADSTLITEVDLFISNLMKEQLNQLNITFYCEEDHSALNFPAAILDPIDGTYELVHGIPECALSLGIFSDCTLGHPKNWGWIFNPFSGFNLTSDTPLVKRNPTHRNHRLLGLVSRSEYRKKLYEQCDTGQIIISEKGSIAYKLGLLASGACDFIVTKQPKNIWDIAAGTLLCYHRDIFLFIDGKQIEKLDQKTYSVTPMIWCRQRDLETIQKAL